MKNITNFMNESSRAVRENNDESAVLYCPLCGSENIEWMGDAFEEGNETPFHCHKCDSFFGVIC